MRKDVHLSLLIFSYFIVSFAPVVNAATFDGVYNYAYNLNGPNGWETHYVDNGFIVSNGIISSSPPALSGTAESSGNAVFTGPSPYGGGSASFTGVIRSDGTGEGTYVDGQGLVGSWSVRRVSGGGTSWPYLILDVMNTFAFIGEYFGLSGTMAASVGTAAVITASVLFISFVTTVGKRPRKPREKHDTISVGEYEAASPDTPSRKHGIPYSAIGVPPPPVSPPTGISDVPRLPSRLNLRANWDKSTVSLTWSTPSYDQSKYKLHCYEVTKLFYDGSGNAPRRQTIDQLAPTSQNWTGPYDQSYRWNTGGDLQGYRVDAIFRDVASDAPRFMRVGENSYAPVK